MRNFIYTAFLVGILLVYKVSGASSTTETEGLIKIKLGGIEQSILIQSNDFSKPILLILHGGPGFAMLPLFHLKNKELEDYFVVVNWDQRGAGRSYSPDISKESMTLSQIISDAHELTKFLKIRFERKKIFLVGHSFGTIIGLNLLREYPNDYFAFCAVGQIVDVIENEQLSYDFALTEAIADNNELAMSELKQIGRPDKQGEYVDYFGFVITMKWVGYYGGDLYGNKNSEEIEEILLNSKIYAEHKQKIVNGWEFSQLLFNDEDVWQLDFRKTLHKVDVPVYFFTGRHDYDTPFQLIQQYYEMLNAPIKEIIWFENSAHFPFFEEPDRFNRMIIEKFTSHTN